MNKLQTTGDRDVLIDLLRDLLDSSRYKTMAQWGAARQLIDKLEESLYMKDTIIEEEKDLFNEVNVDLIGGKFD